MKPHETPMNQYQNLQRWLAHYNQVLRSRPRVSTRHKDIYQLKSHKDERSVEVQIKDQNQVLLNRLAEIKRRPRKSLDQVIVHKASLRSGFKEKQKLSELEKSNLKLYSKLKAVKSQYNHLDAKKDLELKRREKISQTLHYQDQVYKTYTDFLKSNHEPRMYLRTEKDTSKRHKNDLPLFKVEVIQLYDSPQVSANKIKRKSRKRSVRRVKNTTNQQTEPLELDEGRTERIISSRV